MFNCCQAMHTSYTKVYKKFTIEVGVRLKNLKFWLFAQKYGCDKNIKNKLPILVVVFSAVNKSKKPPYYHTIQVLVERFFTKKNNINLPIKDLMRLS